MPKLHPSRTSLFGGLRFSEKTWTYLFALQLLLGEGSSSFFAGLSGAVAGWMYLSNTLGLQSFRLPAMVEVSFSHYPSKCDLPLCQWQRVCSPLGHLFGSQSQPNTAAPNPLVRAARPQQGVGGIGGGIGGGGVGGGRPMPPIALAPPSEESIQSIMVGNGWYQWCFTDVFIRIWDLIEREQHRPFNPQKITWKQQPIYFFLGRVFALPAEINWVVIASEWRNVQPIAGTILSYIRFYKSILAN